MPKYIDADILLHRLQVQQKYCSVQDSEGRAKAILEVMNAPTVDVEKVKHGRWIWENTRQKSSKYICSVCGKIAYDIPRSALRHGYVKKCSYKFCPNCGAKMDASDPPRQCNHTGELCCYPGAPCSTCPEEHGLFDRMEADDDS